MQQRTVIGAVTERLTGRKLVPKGQNKKKRQLKAVDASKAAEEDANNQSNPVKTISFAKGNVMTQPTSPMQSVLKKKPRKPVKVFKYVMVVIGKARISFGKKKFQARPNYFKTLADAVTLMREDLLGGGVDVAILGKEGNRSAGKEAAKWWRAPLSWEWMLASVRCWIMARWIS